jgi:hypothetical protein
LNLLEVNYLAVLVATVVTMVLGFLWYSPVLFGRAWAKLRHVKMEGMSGGGPLTYILTALTALGGSFILALLLTMGDETTWVTGLAVGALIGLSISLKIGMNYLFENAKLPLYLPHWRHHHRRLAGLGNHHKEPSQKDLACKILGSLFFAFCGDSITPNLCNKVSPQARSRTPAYTGAGPFGDTTSS